MNELIGIIHTADIHIYDNHKYSVNGSRQEAIYKSLLRMVKFLRDKKDLELRIIVLAGDIFHTYNPPEKLIRQFSKFVKIAAENNVVVRVITGNHDTNGINHSLESLSIINEIQYTQSIRLFKVFSLNKGEAIFSESIGGINFVYVPWQENLNVVLPKAKNFKTKDELNILVTHCAVDGALTNSDFEIKTKITKKMLSGWDYVALGDFHKYQRLGEKIFYSGSPIKTVWDERHDARAFNYIECSDNRLTVEKVLLPDTDFIEMKMDYSQIDRYLSKKLISIDGKKIENSYIKLFITNQTGYGEKVIELKKHLLNCGANDVFYKIVKSVESSAVKENNGELTINLDLTTLAKLYLARFEISDKNYEQYLNNKVLEIIR